MNDYHTVGNYYCAGTVEAQTIINSPSAVAFTMKVEHSTGTSPAYPCQTVREYSTGKIYYRLYSSGNWTLWKSNVQNTDLDNFLSDTGWIESSKYRYRKIGKIVYVMLNMNIECPANSYVVLGTLPSDFTPSKTATILGILADGNYSFSGCFKMDINTNGQVGISNFTTTTMYASGQYQYCHGSYSL